MEANKIKRLPLPSNWRVIHPTTYVHVDDLLSDEGKFLTVPVVTDRVELHEIENPKTFKKEKKLVVYFKGKEKGLILNATMNKVMQEVSGTRDPRKWGDVSLELFVDPRVRNPQGGKQASPRIRAGKRMSGTNAKLELEESHPKQLNLEEVPEDELEKLMAEAEEEVVT